MAEIKLENLHKTYDDGTKALRGIDLTIQDHDFVVLLGPSGCGKSTLLRQIAGLDQPTEGEIHFDGKLMNGTKPMERNVSMVFQNFALYPHLTVFKNMAFPLKSMKLKTDEIKRRVEETAEILDITHILNRRPRVLSGGQRQRVALGRAMVREPVVFLLDEPLSNLDAKMRLDLRDEIVRLHKRLQTTFVYVTHDQSEAMHMGSHIVVMEDGLIAQVGTPQEVYNFPNSVYVASFVGAPKMNFFASRLIRREDHWAVLVMGKEIAIPTERLPLDDAKLTHGMKVIAGIRPEDFRVEQGDSQLEAEVRRVVPMGAGLHAEMICGAQRFMAVFQNHTLLDSGDVMKLGIDNWNVHVFDAETEKNLCRPVSREEESHETLV